MGTSAFELLVVPIFMATFGAIIAGSAFIGLRNAAEIVIGRFRPLIRRTRPRSAVVCGVRIRQEPGSPRIVSRPKLVG